MRLSRALLFIAATVFFGPFASLADEVCRPCPFDCAGIGSGRKDCRDLSYSRGQCCVDLNGRGMDQLRRRDEENAYGHGRQRDPNSYDDKTGYSPGDCPAGYHVNDRPCTPDERSRGCYDTTSRSGQNCVGWRDQRERQNGSYGGSGAYSGRNDARCGRDRDDSYRENDCPRGFEPDSRPCSRDDRRRGCEDVRSRNGLICTRWN